MWIIIHLKLLKMAPFDRSYDFPSVCHCQYRPIALYCTIFKIFDVEEYRVFEIKVGGQSPCELMHDLYIVKIFRLKRYPFALMVWICLYSLLHSDPKKYKGKKVRYGRSGLLKVIEIGTNPKPICNFLFVFHCKKDRVMCVCIHKVPACDGRTDRRTDKQPAPSMPKSRFSMD